MALDYGQITALSGMSQAIYAALSAQLSPPWQSKIDAATDKAAKAALKAALQESQAAWQTMSFCIAKGVVDHIHSNMEIYGIQTRGDIAAAVRGDTGPADPNSHMHAVELAGTQAGVVFAQSNDGTGHVR